MMTKSPTRQPPHDLRIAHHEHRLTERWTDAVVVANRTSLPEYEVVRTRCTSDNGVDWMVEEKHLWQLDLIEEIRPPAEPSKLHRTCRKPHPPPSAISHLRVDRETPPTGTHAEDRIEPHRRRGSTYSARGRSGDACLYKKRGANLSLTHGRNHTCPIPERHVATTFLTARTTPSASASDIAQCSGIVTASS